MEEVTTGLAKVATGLAAVAIFLGLLLIIFFIGARAKGKLQFPAAMIVFLGPPSSCSPTAWSRPRS